MANGMYLFTLEFLRVRQEAERAIYDSQKQASKPDFADCGGYPGVMIKIGCKDN